MAAAALRSELMVLGGTPAGIVAAVTAAREGVDTLLVSYYEHLGGVMVNGLSAWDTHYEGRRAVIADEWLDMIKEHYRTTYGPDSEQYRACIDGPFGGGRWSGHTTWEPHVAEKMLERLVGAESRLRIVRGYHPVAVEAAGARMLAVSLAAFEGDDTLRAEADAFVDASYEGDLAALAGVPYRVGREARWEYDEQHAGRLFMQRSGAEEAFPVGDERALRYPRDARAGALNLRPWWGVTQEIFSHSTGEGDSAVQAYNHRVVLCRDPQNRRPIEQPAGYQRDDFAPILATQGPEDEPVEYPIKTGLLINPLREFPGVIPLPNGKCDWNVAAIPGGVDAYPDGDWATRRRIVDRHRHHALGLLYFLQHDSGVPQQVRQQAGEWGLPRDEFEDNDNFPREIYIREARRIVGRALFTENDARIGRGLDRAPVHADSIAIAEWLMDSHDCTPARVRGSLGDGFTSMSEVTRPSQVPYRILLPDRFDNLIVGVAMSATHVGWGTLRVEPCLMHVAEAVGMAVALARQRGVAPALIDVEELQVRLVERGVMIAFFNDVDVARPEPWVWAVQFLGSKGFFAGYDAHPQRDLDALTARHWSRSFGALLDGDLEPSEAARRLLAATRSPAATGPPGARPANGSVSGAELVNLLAREIEQRDLGLDVAAALGAELALDAPLSRAAACLAIYTIYKQHLGSR